MFNKTNFMAAAVIAVTAIASAPSANATVAAGMSSASAAAAAITTNAAPAVQAEIVLAGGKRRFRHWRHGWGWGPGYGWGYGYGFRRCHWLKRKARRTGSRYWWNRYYACRDGYFY